MPRLFTLFLLCLLTHAMSQCNNLPPEPGESSGTEGGEGGETENTKLEWFTEELWNELFPHICYHDCDGCGKYKYEDFMKAANSYPGFADSDDEEMNRIELAAFFGQTSHETTGGWETADDGPDKYGYCFYRESGYGTVF